MELLGDFYLIAEPNDWKIAVKKTAMKEAFR